MPHNDIEAMCFEFSRSLRSALMVEIEKRGLEAEDVAELAGLFPSGAESLLRREAWPLESALKVAKGLSLQLRPEFDELPAAG